MENIFYYEDIKKNYFENRWSSLTRGFLSRHKLNYISTIVLLFAYDGIYEKYGKLIPTNDKDSSIQINPMGIMFAKEIDDNYLKEVEELFKDNYEFNFYDFMHYSNIGKIDILEIKNKYHNLLPSTIRDITLYAKDYNIRNILFTYLNDKDYVMQDKICQLIKPISIESTKEKCIDKFGYNKFVELKLMIQKNKELEKDELDKIYLKITTDDNIYFISEFEFLFQDVLLATHDIINNDNIDILLKSKKYVLDKIPKVTGEIRRIPTYKYVEHHVFYGDANDRECAARDLWGTETEIVEDDDYVVNTIDYSIKKVLNEKKAIISLLPMLLENKIDYQELIKYDNYEYIKNLIELINNKEKRLCK